MFKIKNIFLLVAITISSLSAQLKVVVFEFQPIGVDENITQVATTLLKDRLSGFDTFSVIEPAPGTKCYTLEEAVKNSKELNAEKAVIGNITQLGRKLVISYKLIDINTASVEFSDRATISTVEDLDIATERIALSIKEKKPFEGTVEVGKITEIEARQPFRSRTPFSSIIFTTGYTFPLGHQFPYDPGTKLFTIDASVTYETRDLLAQGLMGLRRGKQGFTSIYFDLLIHKILSQYDISPFIGGGIGVHKLEFNPNYPLPHKEDDGPALTVSGGLVFFRTYYFRVLAGLKGTMVFTDEFGTVTNTSFNFGLTSPAFGSEGAIKAPAGCILGCLGAFFLTGVIVALAS